MKRSHELLALLVAGMVGLGATANAQEVQFQGSTKGCFYAAGESGCTPGSSSTLLYLSFLNSTFDVTTVDGMAGIGAAPGTPNVNNLGSFYVSGNTASYTGAYFLLDVVFSMPTITSATTLFTAALKGSVQSFANGLVKIQFDPSTQIFDFAGPTSSGYFELSVNNVSMTPGTSPVSLTGDVSVTATPEPASLALMATGLAGLAAARKRRKARSA